MRVLIACSVCMVVITGVFLAATGAGDNTVAPGQGVKPDAAPPKATIETCMKCEGSGKWPERCGYCGGRGGERGSMGMLLPCIRCRGRGAVPGTCQTCNGGGKVRVIRKRR